MAKKSTGILAALALVAAGAAAVFFAKKENRDLVEKETKKAVKTAKKVKSQVEHELKTNRDVQEIKRSGKRLSQKVLASAEKTVKQVKKAQKLV